MTTQMTLFLGLAFVLHFVADFVLQPRWMGKEKSSNPSVLFLHCMILFMITWLGLGCWKLAFWNALAHAAVDWNIWRIYKRYRMRTHPNHFGHTGMTGEFQWWEDQLFYAFIGFDQLLHGLCLIFLVYTHSIRCVGKGWFH